MFYLILTVFIAELVLLFNILSAIIKADRYVCEMSDTITKRHNLLKWRLYIIKDITQGFNEILPKLLGKAKKNRNKILLRYTNELAQFAILLFCKPSYKKVLLGTKTSIRIIKRLLKVKSKNKMR